MNVTPGMRVALGMLRTRDCAYGSARTGDGGIRRPTADRLVAAGLALIDERGAVVLTDAGRRAAWRDE